MDVLWTSLLRISDWIFCYWYGCDYNAYVIYPPVKVILCLWILVPQFLLIFYEVSPPCYMLLTSFTFLLTHWTSNNMLRTTHNFHEPYAAFLSMILALGTSVWQYPWPWNLCWDPLGVFSDPAKQRDPILFFMSQEAAEGQKQNKSKVDSKLLNAPQKRHLVENHKSRRAFITVIKNFSRGILVLLFDFLRHLSRKEKKIQAKKGCSGIY